MVAAGATKNDAGRKRKVHSKSRRGCRNCKLRRVKCDEKRPQCTVCVKFGVSCNFNSTAGDLQLPGTSQFTIPHLGLVLQDRINPPPVLPPIITGFHDDLKMDRSLMDGLFRFQTRTAHYLGTESAGAAYAAIVPSLALANPYLMHVVLTLTCIHDRYLSISPDRPSIAELKHWSIAAALFNKKLTQKLVPADQDALIASAMLLGVIAFSSTSAASPEEAWPLREESQLEWLPLVEGKKTIWRMASPLAADSKLNCLLGGNQPANAFQDKPHCEIGDVPAAWIRLFDIDQDMENNPYYSAVFMLARLIQMECTRSVFPFFFGFINHIRKDLKTQLARKDARAILLMAIWYAKLCDSQWWIDKRAKLECQSACLYLMRYHGHDLGIQAELIFPLSRCGLDEVPLLTQSRYS